MAGTAGARAQDMQSVPAMQLYATPQQTPVQPRPVPLQSTAQKAPVPAKATAPVPSLNGYATPEELIDNDGRFGSTYIPVDSWVYPAMLRLYGLGYVDTTFISMRPWTRRSLLHALLDSEDDIQDSDDEQAQEIFTAIREYLRAEVSPNGERQTVYGVETGYTRLMGIGGTTLRDSYHLGQSLVNDYGRPYEPGFNSLVGFSTLNEAGRFSLYVRGEWQHAPSATGYSLPLAQTLSLLDFLVYAPPNAPQATIPAGSIATQNPFRLVEANLSYHILGHELSFGKSDAWQGPGQGGAMAWSNNAENIYSFRVNRVEPLDVPLLSRLMGPLRYDLFVGSLKGHTAPNDPWVHSEMFAFRPTSNFEFGFQRTVIWGGKGHEPITLHTFLKSFFSFSDTNPAEKYSTGDPGARFSTFNFSWRLPFLRDTVTLYTDSIAHDDVSPVSAPRRAAYRPGIYISHLPYAPRIDLRVEAASTDTSTLSSQNGTFNYFEVVQLQGYTNKGFIMGDWIGREAKGGQAWLTWHFSGNEWVQLEYLNKKTPKDFIPQGTTQNAFTLDMVKRLRPELELNAWVQFERWKAPIYKTGQQSDTTVAGQLTWYPKLRTAKSLNGK